MLRTWIKDGLWAIVFASLVAGVIRFAIGLGAGSGLNDATPWGMWIAFKLGFVALAGGGFTLAAVVYIFHLERFRPILRRAILMALLGYGSFIVSLIVDLGLPWHIYMPIISWQHHSVMFEIAWCVMLYFSVLVLEFSPAILEHPLFKHKFFQMILHGLHKATLPLVVLGIVLSTLHQSSLGALFLIMPHRVHPLWYSPWQPYLFFTSAIAAGMMALVVEGFLVERWFKRGMHFDLLERLGAWVPLPLGLYLLLRLSDLFLRGVLPGALDGSWQSLLFVTEILVCGILPIGLLAFKRIRQSREGLLTGAILIIAGIVSQRMSLSMFTMRQSTGLDYSPSLAETLIAFGIPAAALLVYLFFAENLALLGDEIPNPQAAAKSNPLGRFSPDAPGRAVFAHRSGLATFVIALMLPALLNYPASAKNPSINPVQPAIGWETLRIDGNQTGYIVAFPHVEHQERLTEALGSKESACATCHHLNYPNDEATSCSQCHTDYYQPAFIFDHMVHQTSLGGNASCAECHETEHVRQSAAICQDCHETMVAQEGESVFNSFASSYKDAMHGRCLNCHEQKAAELDKPELALCSTCHTYYESSQLQTNLP
ncbi:MAG: NrfD/PsrC family molybdoenzyme membrane anchor subunit [Chloroflexota bacterium]